MDAPLPGGLGGTYAGSPVACAAALAVLDLAEVQLEQGKPGDAWQTCRAMYGLVQPLQRIPIIAGALVELLQLEERGLSLDLVSRVRRTIERESRRRDARARRAGQQRAHNFQRSRAARTNRSRGGGGRR